MKIKQAFQSPYTRFSKDGRSAFVLLQVDRRHHEYARSWAAINAAADPANTAEIELEAILNTALFEATEADDWRAPPEIEALYPAPRAPKRRPGDMDDDIPF